MIVILYLFVKCYFGDQKLLPKCLETSGKLSTYFIIVVIGVGDQ